MTNDESTSLFTDPAIHPEWHKVQKAVQAAMDAVDRINPKWKQPRYLRRHGCEWFDLFEDELKLELKKL